ncbi:hypothetical protein [Thalassobellus citreus]|uniref:hypothetical protein n=1 Tax=Thalassobellus citreus TaxID=3367752 RepID=UPI0037A2B0C9
MEKVSKIKLRLLEVAKNKGIGYEKFFKSFGTTYANFKGKSLKSSLRSEVLADFSSIYPNEDLHWIITGDEKKDTNSNLLLNEPVAGYKIEGKNNTESLDEAVRRIIKEETQPKLDSMANDLMILIRRNMESNTNDTEDENKKTG